MGILFSKKISSEFEAYPAVYGRYASLNDEFTTQPANFTGQYKRVTASPAGSLASGRSNGRIAESPLRKRLKYDNTSNDVFEKMQTFMENNTIEIQKAVPSSVVKNEQGEAQIMGASMLKSNRRLSLRQLIRRRPSYRKALRTPSELPLTNVACVIPEKIPDSEHNIEIVDAVKIQAKICAMDTIIEFLNESEYAESEAEVSSEETVESKIMPELKQDKEESSEKERCTWQKSSFKILRRNSQRYAPYETMKPKLTEEYRVEILLEHNHLTTKEEKPEESEGSPLVMGKLLTELKQRIAERKERKRINSLPNLGRVLQHKRDGIQMRCISDMSVEQARIFEKLMIELKQRVAERSAKNSADYMKPENSNMEERFRGLY